MKKRFGALMLSIFIITITVMEYPVSVRAEENAWEDMVAESFAEIAEEKPVYALIYNAFEYQVRKNPDYGESIITVPGGQQVTLLECVMTEEKLWFLCEVAVDDITYQGFVEQEHIVSGDQQYNSWLDTVKGGQEGIAAYAYIEDGPNTKNSDYTYYIENNFPYEYREALLELHQQHPNWIFVPFYTGLDWNTVIDNEMVPTRNLIYITAKDEWKSKAEGDYDAETGTYIGKSGSNWVQASREAVEYFMDPTNFLDEKSIFMFEQLTYDTGAHVLSGVEAILRGTWMSGRVLEDASWSTYADAFMEIASRTGVSPYHLASRIRQEQGTGGTSPLISGTVSGYEGYYNYFNISASGSTNEQIITNGLSYAKSRGWNTRFASLLGGSQMISSSYISKGQDTLYLQKFDVDASYNGLYSHQYMQNIQAPYTEGRAVYNAYHAIENVDNSFVFKIPVYNNMGKYNLIQNFITRLYNTCLDRAPDGVGLAYWTNRLLTGAETGSQAAYGFVFSDEFKEKNLCNEHYVTYLYNAMMGRGPDAVGLVYWLERLENGQTREEVFNGFVVSDEFTDICAKYGIQRGDDMDVPQYGTIPTGACSVCGEPDGVTSFVKRLYDLCLDRDAEADGLAYWCDQLWTHTNSGRGVASGFVFSPEFTGKGLSDEQFVEYMYRVFLGREFDALGKVYWLNNIASGWSREQVFDGFADSEEFDNLCRRYGIVRE